MKGVPEEITRNLELAERVVEGQHATVLVADLFDQRDELRERIAASLIREAKAQTERDLLQMWKQEIYDAAKSAHPEAFEQGRVLAALEFLKAEKDDLKERLAKAEATT